MTIRIERLRAQHVPAVRELRKSQRPDDWPEQLSTDFYRWRYAGRGEAETLLAFDGDCCVAMLDSSFHSYRLAGSIVRVREPSEWYCLPEYRPQGLGLSLMRTFMKEPEPMFAMAGTWMTQDILPLMGWQKLEDTTNYSLPLTSGVLVNSALGYLRFPAGRVRSRLSHAISVPIWRRNPIAPHEQSTVSEFRPGESLPLIEPDREYALACMSSDWEPEWLNRAPTDMGEFVWLVGHSNNRPVGFTVSRLFRINGVIEANLLHVQTDRCSADLYGWLVAETSKLLAGRRATKVFCRASCPTFSAALQRIGFVERSRTPAFWWNNDGSKLDGKMHLTRWRADEAIRPYPTY